MSIRHDKLMTPGDLWFRVGLGAVLIILGFILQAGGFSAFLVLLGAAWIGWAVFRAVRQVRKAEQIQRARNER